MVITSRSVAILLAMALMAVLTVAGTRAVFSAQTDNSGNAFATADILLYDDDSATVMFNVAGLWPGDQVDHCVEVSYEGPNGRATNGVNFYIPATWIDSATLADDLLKSAFMEMFGDRGPESNFLSKYAQPIMDHACRSRFFLRGVARRAALITRDSHIIENLGIPCF